MVKRLFVLTILLFAATPALAVKVGEPAPTITAKNQDGKPVDLGASYGRRPVVLFFYPKSFTRGCTREVQAFRDRAKEFNALDAAIIGV